MYRKQRADKREVKKPEAGRQEGDKREAQMTEDGLFSDKENEGDQELAGSEKNEEGIHGGDYKDSSR